VESPPNGSWLRVRYDNGDDLSIRFREWTDTAALGHVYPRTLDIGGVLRFPLVTAEITFEVGGTNIKFPHGWYAEHGVEPVPAAVASLPPAMWPPWEQS
jgi:hypothetical protein